MQTAAATLAGNAYGAKDKERMNELANMFIPIEVILMIFSGGLLFASAPGLVGLFSNSPEVTALGTTVLRMVALSEPFYGVSIIVEGMMQGVGKTKLPFIYNIAGMWGVRIVGTYICIKMLQMGLVSAWACMIGHNMLLFVLFSATYLRGKWNPLTESEKANL
jgi:Na+-driven multidrug efflux pump